MQTPSNIGRGRDVRWELAAIAVLALAVFNLTFRLSDEMVQVWDESLYATTALEMLRSGDWVVTTFQGTPDYFNSKPPLNAWLIAASFSSFGVSLVSLRLASVTAAILTVLALHLWARREFGRPVATLAALVLATTYGFLYTHSGRTANTDAPLALAVTLTAITAWTAVRRPLLSVWLGPLAATVFMLKGPGALAVIVPLLVGDLMSRGSSGVPVAAWLVPRVIGLTAGALPVAAWVWARYQRDQWQLFSRMAGYDVLARGSSAVEGHAESPFYYLDVLQRHHYDWLLVLAVALAMTPSAVGALRRSLGVSPARLLVPAWLAGTFVVPSLVATKLAWYLNPFFPLFALAVGAAVWHTWSTLLTQGQTARARGFAALVVLAVGVAEGKLAWQSYRQLDLNRSAQGLLLERFGELHGQRVFAVRCPYPEAFLASAADATCMQAAWDEFAVQATRGDLWLGERDDTLPGLIRLGSNRGASLHRKP